MKTTYKEITNPEKKDKGIKKYILSLAIDARVDVKIEAKSLEEAMGKARNDVHYYDMNDIEVISSKPVNITDEDGEMTDF